MRITIIGAGPAGLYFAVLMKKADPSHRITVLERDGADDTFGWGIVFSDQTFGYLEDSDAPSFRGIVAARQTWDNVDVVHRGEKISIHGNRFSGIPRIAFLKILQRRALALGVDLRFQTSRISNRTTCSSAPTARTARPGSVMPAHLARKCRQHATNTSGLARRGCFTA
jgi:anthraniloyl-CoA monooxygenase